MCWTRRSQPGLRSRRPGDKGGSPTIRTQTSKSHSKKAAEQLYAPPFRLKRAVWLNSYRLFMSVAVGSSTAGWAGVSAVCCCGMRCWLRSAGARRCSVRSGCGRPCVGRGCGSVVSARCRRASVTPAIGCGTTSAGISSSAAAAETMVTPAVAIAPAGPWAHTQENAVVEVAWSVEADWSAGVGRIVVVAVGTNRWNTDIDDDLRFGRWRDGQGCEQC
jgi:hypothetical protein